MYPNVWSSAQVKSPIPITSASVKIVAEIHSSRVGHVTRRNSAMTPRKKSAPPSADARRFAVARLRPIALFFCSLMYSPSLSRVFWQGGQDSNPQPLALEANALPIELPPYATLGTALPLPRLTMGTMATTETAVLAQFEPLRRLLLVLLRVVIPALALRAGQHYDHAILLFCHFPRPRRRTSKTDPAVRSTSHATTAAPGTQGAESRQARSYRGRYRRAKNHLTRGGYRRRTGGSWKRRPAASMPQRCAALWAGGSGGRRCRRPRLPSCARAESNRQPWA